MARGHEGNGYSHGFAAGQDSSDRRSFEEPGNAPLNLFGLFNRKDKEERIKALEEEVRKERGVLAVNILNFERPDNALDILVRQHLELLQRGQQ
jgi:hypothetical protein